MGNATIARSALVAVAANLCHYVYLLMTENVPYPLKDP